jgi:sugar transferase (PEP-CTERM system associated)
MLRVFGIFLPASTLVLGLTETLLMGCAVYFLTVSHAGGFVSEVPATGLAQFAFVLAVLALISMSAVGLYSADAMLDYRVMVLKILLAFVIVTPAIGLAILFFKNTIAGTLNVWSLWYLKAAFSWFACVSLTRAIFAQLADGTALKRRVLVVGTGENAARIKAVAQRGRDCHYVPVAFVQATNDPLRVGRCDLALEAGAPNDELAEFALSSGAQEVVVATDDRRGLPVHQLLHCKLRGLKVTDYLTFWERENGRVNLEALQPSWLIFSDGFRMGWFVDAVQRGFDIVVSAAFLLLTAPVLMATAVAIRLESPGPALYRQERVGLRGRTFLVLKFRSMRTDAEVNGKPQWAAKGDPRVTRVGAFIRKFRIDELPQLFNVLRGEMSFIGPRPERPFFVEQLSAAIPFYSERHAVRPGISGWAQINYPYGASLEDARQKLSYDLYYVKNRSVFLDLLILIQTVKVILFAEGSR